MMNRLKVLLVEDNPGDADLVQEYLSDANQAVFEVECVSRLASATELLAVEPFDLILLDLGLPDSSGLETLKVGLQTAGATPIVVLTGHHDEPSGLEAVQLGAQDYILKGHLERNLLVRTILFSLERKRTQETLQKLVHELDVHKTKLEMQNEDLKTLAADLSHKNLEIQTMTQQLWQAAKLATLGELAASVAHELNNPLATVTLRTEELLAKTPDDHPNVRPLKIIDQELDRMRDLVANLLQFSRRQSNQISSINLCEEIDKTLELVVGHLRNHRIEVQQRCSRDVPMIRADRQQLRQVFLNLMTNAADAMPDGGTLTTLSDVETDPPGHVLIQITDTGTGIDAESLEHVMEPFYTTKTEGKGTGLGLPICRRIVQDHGGTLNITSEVGRGTTVSVILPVTGVTGTSLAFSPSTDETLALQM